jgi:hypothetical protein
MHNRIPSRRQDEPKAQDRRGKTLPGQGPTQERVPRMPHERDESADSQGADEPSGKRMGDIAHDDIERGLVDTDKGPVLQETYEKLRDDEPESDRKLSP